MSELMKTPLNAAHRALNAKMVDFGGWDMPVQYPAGIIAEHEAVRTKAGLFDVSHMGEIRVKGPGALALVEHLTPNAVSNLVLGQIHYTAFLYENGTFVDDLLVYREGEDEFLLVVNAGNSDKDFAWVQQNANGYDCTVVNESPATGQIALQGPLALAMGLMKGFLYLHRKRHFAQQGRSIRPLVGALRLAVGMLGPALLLTTHPLVAAGMALLGDLVDRAEYYDELEVPTPQGELLRELRARVL